MGNCLSCIRRGNQSINYSQLQQFPDSNRDNRQQLVTKDQRIQELERQLELVNEELKMETQKLLSVQARRGEQLSAKCKHTEDLEQQLESVHEELMMEKQKLLSLQEEKEEQLLAENFIEELERQLKFMNEKLKMEKLNMVSVQKEKEEQEQMLRAKSQYIQELERQLKSVNDEVNMEKQKLLCVKGKDEQKQQHSAQSLHMEEEEEYLKSVDVELKVEKQVLVPTEEERDEQQQKLASKGHQIQELRIQLESVNEELKMEKQNILSVQKKKEQHQTLSAKIEQLEGDVESLRNELAAERSLKERELQKMTTKREKEIIEYKKRLASIMWELKAEKRRSPPVQEELSAKDRCQNSETLSLKHFSSLEPALRKNHKAYFRGFFLLCTPLLINGQPAEVSPNEKGWLTLTCPTTDAAVTFNDLYIEVSAAIEKCGGLYISSYWCDDVSEFQVNVSSTDSLKKLLCSKSQLQKQLTSKLSHMFKKETQVQLQSDVCLVLPSASDSGGQIVHVTLDNAEECMARWERSAVFTFQAIFHEWNEHSLRTEPTLGSDDLRELINELDDISAKWESFGVQLEVPYSELDVISHNHGKHARECLREMMRWWLENDLEAKWSKIVQSLAKIGRRKLAYRIAVDHGIPTTGIMDVSTTSDAVEHLRECPSPVQKELMKTVDELKRSIRSKDHKFRKQQDKLDRAKRDGEKIRENYANVTKELKSLLIRTEELEKEKLKLEKDLKLREDELEVLKHSTKPEKVYFIVLRQEDAAELQKELQFVRQELQEERHKIPPLQKEIQSLLFELAKKSEEIHHLRNAKEETNSQLKMEREKVEMKTKELTAAAVSC